MLFQTRYLSYGFYDCEKNAMTMATHIRKIFNWSGSLTVSVHYHQNGEYGGIQAGMVLLHSDWKTRGSRQSHWTLEHI